MKGETERQLRRREGEGHTQPTAAATRPERETRRSGRARKRENSRWGPAPNESGQVRRT